jgi:tetratricopeptide (TPR) repeat protein
MKCQVARYLIFPLILGACTNLFGERRPQRALAQADYSAINQQALPVPLQFDYSEARYIPQLVAITTSVAGKQFDQACINLQQARSVNDSSLLAALHVWCLTANGNLSAAQQIMQTAVTELSVDQHLAYAGAILNERIENYELAYSLYKDLYSVHEDRMTLLACARTSLLSGLPAECIAHLDHLLLTEAPSSQQMMMRASAFAELQRYAEAMSILQKLLADWPEDPALLQQTSLISFEFARQADSVALYADSAELLLKLIELDPQNSQACLCLARCYSANDAANEAIDAYQRCIEIEPHNVEACHELSDVFVAYNNKQQARQILQQLLKQPISASQSKETNDKLRALK